MNNAGVRRRIWAVLAPALESLLGRPRMARLGHYILNYARKDTDNNPATNGERVIQECVAQHLLSTEGPVVFDVGANVGDWSVSMHKVAAQQRLRLFAFEPSQATHLLLQQNLGAIDELRARLIPVQKALSDAHGEALLHVFADGAGVNSLHHSWTGPSRTEAIQKETLENFCRIQGIDRIAYLKIDAEGHDLAVLKGGRELLMQNRISALQFEYNHRWIYSRSFLKDAFEFLCPFGYAIGKIVPQGVEFYPEWDRELETFREANFIALSKRVKDRFPTIAWWKDMEKHSL